MRINVVLIAVLALAITGASCTQDPDPSPIPPATSTSSTPSATPTPAPPVMPAEARADSPAGAESFARYWLTALNYAYQSGDTTPLRSLGNCAGCKAIADAIDRVRTEHGRIEGGKITILDGRPRAFAPKRSATVEVYYSQASGQTVYGDGHSSPVPTASRLGFLFTLKRTTVLWQVESVQTITNG